jgi:hypothetical protein
MSFYLNSVKQDQCVCLSCEGKTPFSEIAVWRQEASHLLMVKHWHRVVVDVAQLMTVPTALELYTLIDSLSSNLPPNTRVALVVRPEQTRHARLNISRFNPLRPMRERAWDSIEAAGTLAGDPNLGLADRRAALLALQRQLKAAVNVAQDKLAYGDFSQVVRVTEFTAEINQAESRNRSKSRSANPARLEVRKVAGRHMAGPLFDKNQSKL